MNSINLYKNDYIDYEPIHTLEIHSNYRAGFNHHTNIINNHQYYFFHNTLFVNSENKFDNKGIKYFSTFQSRYVKINGNIYDIKMIIPNCGSDLLDTIHIMSLSDQVDLIKYRRM